MKRTTLSAWVGAVAIVSIAAGCGGPANRTTTDAERDGRGAAGQARDGARDAGNAVGNAVMEGGRAADAAVETMDVKTALMADSRIDSGDINVDTDHNTRTVTLNGHVPSAAQKAFAEEIAIAKATGYRVENKLTVSN